MLNGIFWILRTGAQWKDFPDRCPAYQACHRRFQKWSRNGTMRTIICSLAKDLRKCGKIDIENHLWMEHSFLQKKGAQKSENKSVGRVQRSWAIGDSYLLLHRKCFAP
ncbi:transposase [Leptospira santarosai]|uniref:transposase n=1 Tax=Leptospira santarosai TaxID=28183 RepID=UPI001911AB7F|nr:transposase [Leptospira santarosai]